MSMIVSRSGPTFALLTMDSRRKLTHADGRIEYDDDAEIPFRAFPSGFVAACGRGPITWAALGALVGSKPSDMDDAVSRVRPAMREAAERTDTPSGGAAHLVTVGSGEMESAVCYADGRVERIGPGVVNAFQPPFGADRELAIERFREYEAEAEPGCTGYELIRAVARFYADIAERTPTVSGKVRLGLVQRPPGQPWTSAYLVAQAGELADATDSDISDMLRTP